MNEWIEWILANPEGAAALASAITAAATLALVAVGLLIGSGQIAVVWWGIRSMMRSGEAREREHERCHRETMQDMKDRHEEAMRTAADRHDESMRKHDESMRKHDESMRALEALIERTAPPRVPAK